MKRVILAGAALMAVAGCTTQSGGITGISLFTPTPQSAEDALD